MTVQSCLAPVSATYFHPRSYMTEIMRWGICQLHCKSLLIMIFILNHICERRKKINHHQTKNTHLQYIRTNTNSKKTHTEEHKKSPASFTPEKSHCLPNHLPWEVSMARAALPTTSLCIPWCKPRTDRWKRKEGHMEKAYTDQQEQKLCCSRYTCTYKYMHIHTYV